MVNPNVLPPLPYAYNALEPAISEEIMKLHHQQHHQAYVNALNAAEAKYAVAATPKERSALLAILKFNGGGHINHSLFWTNLSPIPAKGGVGGQLDHHSKLAELIKRDFKSLDQLKSDFNAATLSIQGSGWGWLGYNKKREKLEIATTLNQDPLLELVPIIGVDIWEHAYYLQYKNVKAKYLENIWTIINFQEAQKRLDEALSVPKL